VDFSSSLSFLPTNSFARSTFFILEIQTSLVHLPAFREMGPVQQQQQQRQQPSEMGEKMAAPASDSDRRRRSSGSSSPHVTIQEPGQPEHQEERQLASSKSRRDVRKSRSSRSADRRSSSTSASSSGAVDGVAPIRAGAYPPTGAVLPAHRPPLPRAVPTLPAYLQSHVAG